MTGSNNGRDYAVGYGKPPKATQFKQGKSGNQRGSSMKVRQCKMDREASAFDVMILDESARPVAITENGKRTQVSIWQATHRSLMLDAAKGDRSAQKLIIPQVQAAQERHQAATMERFGLLVHYVTSQRTARNGSTPQDAPVWPHPDDIVVDYQRCIGEVVGPIDPRQAQAFDALIADRHLWQARLDWLNGRTSRSGDGLEDCCGTAIAALLDTISRALPPSFQAQLDWEASEASADALEIESLESQTVNLALLPPDSAEWVFGLYQLANGAQAAAAAVVPRARLDITANTTALINRLRVERQSHDAGMATAPTAPDFDQFYAGFAIDSDKTIDAAVP